MCKKLVIAGALPLLVFLQGGCSVGRAERPTEERRTATEDGQKRELRFPDVVREIKRCAAFVEIRTNNDTLLRKGTAFLLDRSGIAATCWHNLFETTHVDPGTAIVPDTAKIFLQFFDRKPVYQATMVDQEPGKDIALLQVAIPVDDYSKYSLAPIEFTHVSEIEEGLDVGCTGYDLGQKSDTFGREFKWFSTHRGIVSCRMDIGASEKDEDLTQFQASMLVNKGSSGAPVYRADDGRLVGMVKSFMGRELPGAVVNYGIANCVPALAIAKLYEKYKQRLAAKNN